MVTETQTWRHSPSVPHGIGDQGLTVAQHRPRFKIPFARFQGGPQTVLLPAAPHVCPAAPAAHGCFSCQQKTPVQRGPWVLPGSLSADRSRFGVFPGPAWHPWLLHWNLPFHCSQEIDIMFPLPCWDLAADYSFHVVFSTRKSTFLPPCCP